jgi:DnaJ like chaperone protein
MTFWQTLSRRASSTLKSGAAGLFLRTFGLDDRAGTRPDLGIAFTIAIVALSAKMAKSDGVVTEVEIDAFRRVCRFPREETENVRRVFDLARQDVAGFEHYAGQLGRLLADDRELRLDVLEALFVIAAADGVLHEAEDSYLRRVALLLDVSESELAWVRSLFVAEAADPYTVLGLTPGASDAEIKARRRALAFEHHPDRLVGRGLPPDFVVLAERKLASINAAYEAIARERGL